MKRLASITISLLLALSLAACSQSGNAGEAGASDTAAAGETAEVTAEASATPVSADEMFSDRDYEIGYSDYVTVTLADGATAADGDGVAIDGDTVTINAEGTYLLTGTLSNGQIRVDIGDSDKVQLVLDNVSITKDGSAAIYIVEGDKVFVTTAADSDNTLVSTGEFTDTDDDNVDGAIFSKADLTLNGSGALTVESETGHGIVSKDDLRITGGEYAITSSLAALSGKDSIRIADGAFVIDAGTDGLHSENDDESQGFVYIASGTFDITAGNDGISASSTLTVLGGDYDITTGGGAVETSGEAFGGGMGGGQPGSEGGTPPEMPSGGQPSGGQPSGGQPSGGQPGGGQPGGEMPDASAAPDGVSSATSEATAAPDSVSSATSEATAAPDSVSSATPEASASADEGEAADGTEQSASASDSYKGLKAALGITIAGGTFNLSTLDDAIHSNGYVSITGGELTLSTGDDGVHADSDLTVADGSVNVTMSYEGLEAETITIAGGAIVITASDDGLNAAGGNDSSGSMGSFTDPFSSDGDAAITISGGELTINASGDGIDSNGDLLVTGGTTYVSGPTNSGNGALDYAGEATITGGTVIAAGSSGMAVNFGSGSTQGTILYAFSSTLEAGTAVSLTDGDGNELAAFTPEKEFQCVVISAAGMEAGATYTITAGSESAEITLDSIAYSNGGGEMRH